MVSLLILRISETGLCPLSRKFLRAHESPPAPGKELAPLMLSHPSSPPKPYVIPSLCYPCSCVTISYQVAVFNDVPSPLEDDLHRCHGSAGITAVSEGPSVKEWMKLLDY